MENKIKLKVGQKVKFRNGSYGKVIKKVKNYVFDFKVLNVDSLSIVDYKTDGTFMIGSEESEFDIVEILEEPKNKDMEENKGKFELSITVNDVNNSCKNDKYYFDEFTELSTKVRNVTFNKICLTKFETEQRAFENKGDTLKLSKVININGKELGKVTIRVTQLKD